MRSDVGDAQRHARVEHAAEDSLPRLDPRILDEQLRIAVRALDANRLVAAIEHGHGSDAGVERPRNRRRNDGTNPRQTFGTREQAGHAMDCDVAPGALVYRARVEDGGQCVRGVHERRRRLRPVAVEYQHDGAWWTGRNANDRPPFAAYGRDHRNDRVLPPRETGSGGPQ